MAFAFQFAGPQSRTHADVTVPSVRMYSHIPGQHWLIELVDARVMAMVISHKYPATLNVGPSISVFADTDFVRLNPLPVIMSTLCHYSNNYLHLTGIDLHPLVPVVVPC